MGHFDAHPLLDIRYWLYGVRDIAAPRAAVTTFGFGRDRVARASATFPFFLQILYVRYSLSRVESGRNYIDR